MAPAECLRHRSGLPLGEVEAVVAGIGIGLQNASELLQVSLGMITRAVARGVKQGCRW
jgi:hypothetical protein